jgi:hypothetical protein
MDIAMRLCDERDEARRQLAEAQEMTGRWIDWGLAQSGMYWRSADVRDELQSEVDKSNELLSAAQRDLAEANTLLLGAALKYQESQEQLAEARKIVWRLIEWWRDPSQGWEDLPRWLRKEIER